MKKYKMTFKTLKQSYKNIINVGYCRLQHLLYFNNAEYYISGIYGWNCDVYQTNPETVIVTGYKVCGTMVEYTIVEKYDTLAAEIISNKDISWDDKKFQVNNLLEKFVKEVI